MSLKHHSKTYRLSILWRVREWHRKSIPYDSINLHDCTNRSSLSPINVNATEESDVNYPSLEKLELLMNNQGDLTSVIDRTMSSPRYTDQLSCFFTKLQSVNKFIGPLHMKQTARKLTNVNPHGRCNTRKLVFMSYRLKTQLFSKSSGSLSCLFLFASLFYSKSRVLLMTRTERIRLQICLRYVSVLRSFGQ